MYSSPCFFNLETKNTAKRVEYDHTNICGNPDALTIIGKKMSQQTCAKTKQRMRIKYIRVKNQA